MYVIIKTHGKVHIMLLYFVKHHGVLDAVLLVLLVRWGKMLAIAGKFDLQSESSMIMRIIAAFMSRSGLLAGYVCICSCVCTIADVMFIARRMCVKKPLNLDSTVLQVTNHSILETL